MKVLLAVGCLFALVGCAGPVPHSWQSRVTDLGVVPATSSWPLVPQEDYRAVSKVQLDLAVEMLAEATFVQLTPERARGLAGEVDWSPGDGLTPYLVRGVAHGSAPAYTVVRFDAELGRLVVHHATWNGENPVIGYLERRSEPCPLVVWLPVPLTKVYATAGIGGDGVFRRAPQTLGTGQERPTGLSSDKGSADATAG